MFRHQMSITSLSGAGSTTLVEGLQSRLDGRVYRFGSGGTIMREKAEENGMTVEEFAEHCRLHPEEGHDKDCDNRIVKLADSDFFICDGRLAHYFMPEAYHVLLVCDPYVRAERRRQHEKYREMSYADVLRALRKRDEDDSKRYEELYGPECLWSPEGYHLVVDTDRTSKADTVMQVLEGFVIWQTQAASV